MLAGLIALIYHALVAYIVVVMMYNLVKARRWDTELLYVIVLIPFLLRLFRLK